MDRRTLLIRTLTFLAAVGVFTPLAVWRAGDLRHTIGTATDRGGRVRHGAEFEYGRDRYTILVSGRTALKETADLRVRLEGEPPIPYAVYSNYPPTIDLGVHDWPAFANDTLRGCNPGEKLGLWVVLRPAESALPPDGVLPSAEYAITLRDADEKAVLSVPVTFRDPRAPHGSRAGDEE